MLGTSDLDPGGPAAGKVPAELPAHWPSPWPHLYRPVRDRVVFVVMVVVLTTAGLVGLGDPAAQWWAIALPLLLLIGPVSKPARVRMALHRGGGRGALRTQPGRLAVAERGTTVWLSDVPLDAGPVGTALRGYAGSPALLVWTPRRRNGAAVVLPDRAVVYLSRRPSGARAAAGTPDVSDEAGWTLPTR
jgi:hypothetical protein